MRQSAPAFPAALAGLAGASAVLLGAYGAHGLQGVLDARHLEVWNTAVRFQFWHALALALAVVLRRGPARTGAIAGFAVGVLLFCGSLYLLALGAPRWVGFITPFGGVAFVVAWLALGRALYMQRPTEG